MNPYPFEAIIFDLDGVVTKTASVHAKAWKDMFDEYLRLRERRDGEAFREFTHVDDYLPYLDGKPRYSGVKSFLESRDIHIPYGDPGDPADRETVCGLGNKKNHVFQHILKTEGSEIYPSTIDMIHELKKTGVRIGIASSSKNCALVLESAKIQPLFETRVDGMVSAEIGLNGKPEPDIFVRACRNLGCAPERSIVVEDASSGVQAGKNGGFGLVIGVARKNNETELLDNGADVVVRDLADLDREWLRRWFERTPRSFFESWESLSGSFLGIAPNDDSGMIVHPLYYRDARGALFRKERLAIFLDYDGTLTPIVQRPQDAVMSEDMRSSVSALSRWHRVGIVSGRMREDVENLVKIPELLFAGSHGFDIRGPDMELLQPKARETLPLVARITEQLKEQVKDIPGALIEEKKFSVAVHYRLVEEDRYLDRIREYVDSIVSAHSGQLKLLHGKKVLEILPDMEWDKGKAIRWVMNALGLEWNETSVVYIGDDVTDEFAFRTITTRGTAILVSDENRHSAADFRVSSVKEVKKIFEKIIETSTKQ